MQYARPEEHGKSALYHPSLSLTRLSRPRRIRSYVAFSRPSFHSAVRRYLPVTLFGPAARATSSTVVDVETYGRGKKHGVSYFQNAFDFTYIRLTDARNII